MDKIFVIVWHMFMGGDAGEPYKFLAKPFPTQEICRNVIMETMREYDRDKVIKRNFYVDCMNFDDIKHLEIPGV